MLGLLFIIIISVENDKTANKEMLKYIVIVCVMTAIILLSQCWQVHVLHRTCTCPNSISEFVEILIENPLPNWFHANGFDANQQLPQTPHPSPTISPTNRRSFPPSYEEAMTMTPMSLSRLNRAPSYSEAMEMTPLTPPFPTETEDIFEPRVQVEEEHEREDFNRPLPYRPPSLRRL